MLSKIRTYTKEKIIFWGIGHLRKAYFPQSCEETFYRKIFFLNTKRANKLVNTSLWQQEEQSHCVSCDVKDYTLCNFAPNKLHKFLLTMVIIWLEELDIMKTRVPQITIILKRSRFFEWCLWMQDFISISDLKSAQIRLKIQVSKVSDI